jgi:hypothetical protein
MHSAYLDASAILAVGCVNWGNGFCAGHFFACPLGNFPFGWFVFDGTWPVAAMKAGCGKMEGWNRPARTSVKVLLLVLTISAAPVVCLACLLLLPPVLIASPILGNCNALRTIGALLTFAHLRPIFTGSGKGNAAVKGSSAVKDNATGDGNAAVENSSAIEDNSEMESDWPCKWDQGEIFEAEEEQPWPEWDDDNLILLCKEPPERMKFSGWERFAPFLEKLGNVMMNFKKIRVTNMEETGLLMIKLQKVIQDLWRMARERIPGLEGSPNTGGNKVEIQKIIDRFEGLCLEMGNYLDTCVDGMETGMIKLMAHMNMERLRSSESFRVRFMAVGIVFYDDILDNFVAKLCREMKTSFDRGPDIVEIRLLLNNLLAKLGVYGFKVHDINLFLIAWVQLGEYYQFMDHAKKLPKLPKGLKDVWERVWEEQRNLLIEKGNRGGWQLKSETFEKIRAVFWTVICEFLPCIAPDRLLDKIFTSRDINLWEILLGPTFSLDQVQLTDDLLKILDREVIVPFFSHRGEQYKKQIKTACERFKGYTIGEIYEIVDSTENVLSPEKENSNSEDRESAALSWTALSNGNMRAVLASGRKEELSSKDRENAALLWDVLSNGNVRAIAMCDQIKKLREQELDFFARKFPPWQCNPAPAPVSTGGV